MSIQAVAWAIRQKVGSPTGKVLLLCLANYADENGECWPSQTTISNEAELGERATRDWLKALEDAGFIERRRRNRADGSRTSDLFRLCLEKRTENPPSGLPAKSAGRPNQPAGSSAPTGISRRAYRQEMPGNEPVREPSEEPTTSAHARGGSGFDIFWDSWPEKEQPQKRHVAQRLFERLTNAEREAAIDNASTYRRHQAGAGAIGLMIPYLRQQHWQDFVGAPPVDSSGYFVVTPDRPEWSVWIEAIRLEYGERAVESSLRLGKILRRQRWPELPAAKPATEHDHPRFPNRRENRAFGNASRSGVETRHV